MYSNNKKVLNKGTTGNKVNQKSIRQFCALEFTVFFDNLNMFTFQGGISPVSYTP